MKQYFQHCCLFFLLLSASVNLPAADSSAYDTGIAFEAAKEWEKAYTGFQLAALQGDVDGKVMLGVCYMTGMGTARNYEAAFELFQEAAEKGDSTGEFNLAVSYENGYGTKRDLAKAFFWYQRAASHGNPEGMYELGQCYYYGAGTEKNHNAALVWFRKAAKENEPQAQNFLGALSLEKGDSQKAFQYFRQSADQGLAEAQYRLGLCYETGKGVRRSLPSAVKWFEKSASQEYVPALQKMSDCYRDGIGVEKDAVKAISLGQRADREILHEKQRPEDFDAFLKEINTGTPEKALEQFLWLYREWNEYHSWLGELYRWTKLFETDSDAREFLRKAVQDLESQILAGDYSQKNIDGVLEINRMLGNDGETIKFYRELCKKNPKKAKQYWNADYLVLFIDQDEYEIPEKLTDPAREFRLQVKIYRNAVSVERKYGSEISREYFSRTVQALTKLLRKYNQNQEADRIGEEFRNIIN